MIYACTSKEFLQVQHSPLGAFHQQLPRSKEV